MGNLLEIVTPLHRRSSRDHLARMTPAKPEQMRAAKRYGREYWDGDRTTGYGGYVYDGRWAPVAQRLVERYRLGPDARILDVGCGKGFLLYELGVLLPRAELAGIDISEYAVAAAKPEISDCLRVGRAQDPLPWPDGHFDLVVSLGALHNLRLDELRDGLREIERVGRAGYVMVESFRNEEELCNLQCWALTCETFLAPETWAWWFEHVGYTGDYEFIYFE